MTSTLAAIARGLPCGARRPDARPDNEAMKPLEMWGYETSPFVRPVRETLCALTLPHVVVPCARRRVATSRRDCRPWTASSKNLSRVIAATSRLPRTSSPSRHRRHVATPPHVVAATRSPQARGSANRDRMVRETGRFQVPFLRDPNTGVELFESAAIVAYLDEVYTV